MSVTPISHANGWKDDPESLGRIQRQFFGKQVAAFYNVLEHLASLPIEQRAKFAFAILRGKVER